MAGVYFKVFTGLILSRKQFYQKGILACSITPCSCSSVPDQNELKMSHIGGYTAIKQYGSAADNRWGLVVALPQYFIPP